MQTYDVNFFIDFFSSIPEDKWCTGTGQNELGQKCAHGHMDIFYREDKNDNPVNTAFLNLAVLYFNDRISFVYVNDGRYKAYKQDTPKQRILAALSDIKAKIDAEGAVEIVQEIINSPIKIQEYETV